MDEFLILMRLDIITKEPQSSPEQMQGYMKRYQNGELTLYEDQNSELLSIKLVVIDI